MHRLSRAAALVLSVSLLSNCVTKPPTPTGQYRDASAQIYSSAVLQPSRMAGRWQQVAGFGPQSGCKPGGVEISGKAQLTAVWRLCLSGVEAKGAAPMLPTGPGRFDVAGQAWWVLWADTDYRTLVIGTPSGGFGFILNRDARLPPDRLAAAKEILDWNGYDVDKLQVYGR